jgi:hypothetical protein
MTQHPDIAIWIQSGLISIMVLILWWSIKGWIKGVNEKLSTMSEELRTLGNKNIGFEKDLGRLDRGNESFDKRMHDYSERLRSVEQTQARCRNCPPSTNP